MPVLHLDVIALTDLPKWVLLGSRKEAVTVEDDEGGYLFDGNPPSNLDQALVQPFSFMYLCALDTPCDCYHALASNS